VVASSGVFNASRVEEVDPSPPHEGRKKAIKIIQKSTLVSDLYILFVLSA